MKNIDINIFDIDSLDAAIKEVEAYAKSFEEKVSDTKIRLAEECASYAQANFDDSWYDDYVDVGEGTYAFSAKTPNVICFAEDGQDNTCVKAMGNEAVFVEFGAGIHYNLSVGSSPHPWGVENGMTIGGYGFGQGKKHSWVAPHGISRGTKAQMPLYNACLQTEQIAKDIAKEIFND